MLLHHHTNDTSMQRSVLSQLFRISATVILIISMIVVVVVVLIVVGVDSNSDADSRRPILSFTDYLSSNTKDSTIRHRMTSMMGSSMVDGDLFGDVLCRWNVLKLCVCSASQLEDSIAAGGDTSSITLCRNSNLEFTDTIEISNKQITIQCSTFLSFVFGSTCTLNGRGAARLFSGTNAKLKLLNLQILNGSVRSALSNIPDGGAIYLVDSTLTVENCYFQGNEALNGAGGSIALEGGTGDHTIKNTLFISNGASDGGAIASKDNTGSLTIKDCTFENNEANAAGAIILNNVQSITIDSSKFFENTASTRFGGAIAIFNAKVEVVDSIFAGNVARTHSESADVFIFDDSNPNTDGTDLKCDQTIFCNGINVSENNGLGFDNTNCDEGSEFALEGTPGQGSCPSV